MGLVERQIREKLTTTFHPDFLEVVNFSAAHSHHAGVEGDQTGETHFRIQLKAKQLEGLSRVAAERLVHKALAPWIGQPIHALQIKILTD